MRMKCNKIANSFCFYRSYFESIKTLSQKNKLIAYEAIAEYALNGKMPTDLPVRVLAIFNVVVPNLDANRRKYLKKMEKEAKENPNGTTPIFENEVILPKKEEKIIRNTSTDNDDEWSVNDEDFID